jgi:hypothetical protein
MRKLLSTGVVVFAGVVSLPSSLSHQPLTERMTPAPAEDPRLEKLRKFFEARQCPALSAAHVFVEVADLYDLDWRLLPSISFIESTGGKFAPNNNLFGWDSGRAEFTSVTAGIQRVAYALANSRYYKNKSLDEVLQTYNPDAQYAHRVKTVMKRISPSE